MLAIMRDIAAASQGATATATDEFSADFPAAGAIDGQLHHLNYGPAASSEDGFGKSGWKSLASSDPRTITSRADWDGGLQSFMETLDNAIETSIRAQDPYSQDFNALTLGDLGGQDGWTKVTALGGNAIVQSSVPLEGSQSLRFDTDAGIAPKVATYQRVFSDPIDYSFKFRHRRTTTTDATNVRYFGAVPSGLGSWTVQFFPSLSPNQLFFSGTGVHSQPIDTADHDYEVRLVAGSLTFRIDGVLVFTTTPLNAGGLRRIDIDSNRTSGTSAEVIGYADLFAMTSLGGMYEQDFDALAAGALAGQDGWTSVSGTGTINVASAGIPAGLSGQAIRMLGDANKRVRRRFNTSAPTSGFLTLRRNRTILGGGAQSTYFRLILRDSAGAVDRYEIRATAEAAAALYAGIAGAPINLALESAQVIGVMGKTGIDWSAAAAGATVRFWVNGIQVDQQIINMTGVDTVDLDMVRGPGPTDPELWIDEIRIGSKFEDVGTQENVIDWGVVPSGAAAEFSFSGENDEVNRILPGAFYSMANNDATFALRRASAPLQVLLAQTFESTSLGTVDAVALQLFRQGTNPPGVVWVELRTVDGSNVPTSTVLATSRPVLTSTISATSPGVGVIFRFPAPGTIQANRRYALVLVGNYVVSDANNIALRLDSSASGYAVGEFFISNNGTTWAVQAGHDAGFVLYGNLQVEEVYDIANQDSSLPIGASASQFIVYQSFKIPIEYQARVFQFLIRKHEGATFAAGDRFYLDLRADDGTGKPGATLATSIAYNPSLVTWGGTEAAQVFELFSMVLAETVRLSVGAVYHLVLRGTWAASATNHLDLGVDASSPSYANGNAGMGDSATPTAWSAAASDLIFAALGPHRPFFEFAIAFSDDAVTYTAPVSLRNNPSRLGSLGVMSFSGQRKRYWKIISTSYRKTPVGADRIYTARLADFTMKLFYKSAKALTVAFGSSRTLSRIEAIAHPIEGGMRKVKFEVSTNGGGAYSDLSSFLTIEARRRGGGATATQAGAEITTDGDYLALDLAADVAGATHLRMTVLESNDDFARVIELRAFRAVDFGSRVLGDPVLSQQADFVQRRFRARQFALSLDNTDAFLSPLGNLGGFNDELGEGMRFIFSVGYAGAELIRMGEFWVDNWREDPKTSVINVQSRDLTKNADTAVRARTKSNIRSWELFEYLMNLSNIPSQWLILDRTANRIKFFADPEPNAYQVAHTIAEAAGFAQVFVDRQGYMNFRGAGTSAGDTGKPTIGIASEETNERTFGPPVMFRGSLYVVGGGRSNISPPSLHGELKLQAYNPKTGAWTTSAAFWVGASGSFAFGSMMFVYDDTLFILVWEGNAATSIQSLYSWDGTIFTLLTRFIVAGAEDVRAPGVTIPAVYQEGNRVYLGGLLSPNLAEYDLLTLSYRQIVFSYSPSVVTGFWAGLAMENGRRIALNAALSVSPHYKTKLYEWDPFARTATEVVSSFNAGVGQYFPMGMTATGKGYVYVMDARRLSGIQEAPPFKARLVRVEVPGFTLTEKDELWIDSTRTDFQRDGDCMAYIDGVVFGAGMQAGTSAPNASSRRMLMHLEESDRSASSGSITFGACRIAQYRAFVIDGQSWVYGLTDDFKVFEVQVRRLASIDTAPVIDLADQPDNLLLGASLDHGADFGGENRIINVGIVKSEPLIDFAPETLWTADRLPWIISTPCILEFTVELKEAGISLTPSITLGGGAAASVSISGEAKQPKMTINVTAGGTILALSISGRPLRKAATLVATAIGRQDSIQRFGARSRVVQNDFIYDVVSAAPIAVWLVVNFQDKKAKVDGVRTMALWILELLDLVRLRDSRTGLDKNFYVTGYRTGLRSQATSLTLLQK